MKQFDAIIIGTGQAGPPMAGRLTAAGMKTAIIERDKFGGSCVNTGCIPTKALVASARAAYMANRAADFGIMIGGSISVDMEKVKARKDAISGRSNQGLERWLKSMENCTVYEGHARFENNRTVSVGGEKLTAEKIFINVGGRARVPDMPGLKEVNYLTNSSIMQLDYVPEHLIIVGGSYVGLEFAQMFRRFGSEVTIIEMGTRLIQRDDEDISQAVKEILENEGINIRLNAECIAVKKQGNSVAVNLDCDDNPREVAGSHLLLAVGRVPNTDDLGLQQTDLKVDERGFIEVDDQLATNVQGIWALGDCNGRGAFTHTAYNDFEIAAENLLDHESRKVSDRILCYGLFIDPPLGRAGMTEAEVRDSGRKALIGKREMVNIGRANQKGETQGFMKILVDAESEEILGAAVLGVGGDEVIHSILDVMYSQKPYTLIQKAVHIHPTVSELIPTMLGELRPLK